jgi:hypothetical protein
MTIIRHYRKITAAELIELMGQMDRVKGIMNWFNKIIGLGWKNMQLMGKYYQVG